MRSGEPYDGEMRVSLMELEAVVGPWATGLGFGVRSGGLADGERVWVDLGSQTLEIFALDAVGNVAVEFFSLATRKRHAYSGPIPDLKGLLEEALLAARAMGVLN
jgi:hypothetical protein